MALLAHRTFAGLHFLTKWESRNVPLNATSELASFSTHTSFVSRCVSHLQPLHSGAYLSSGIRNCAAINDAVAGVLSSVDSTSVLTEAPTEARCRDNSHSQASTSRDHSVPPPATQLRGWVNGGGMVHEEARVHSSVIVEVGAVVQAGAVVEKDVRIGACSVVGHNVRLGERTILWNNVSLQHCTIGRDCILHNGVCIGQDGFGFFVNDKGEMVKKPQVLNVVIGDHVEVGANSCIDRGSWRDTEIGDYTKLDNLVQVGHNVKIGRCCLLCGQVGIGGSAELGDYVVLGGKAGVADHINVHSHVRIAAKTGVIADIKEKGEYAGFPAVPAREWRRSAIAVKRLGREGKHVSGVREAQVGNIADRTV